MFFPTSEVADSLAIRVFFRFPRLSNQSNVPTRGCLRLCCLPASSQDHITLPPPKNLIKTEDAYYDSLHYLLLLLPFSLCIRLFIVSS